MHFKWFSGITTIEELKKKYRELILKYHPDRYAGGDKEMKEINNEYEKLFDLISSGEKFKNKNRNKRNTGEHAFDGFREIIIKIVNLEGIKIEICGSWIWVTGSTFQYKEIFKNLGFSWRKAKKAWSWNPPEAELNNNYKKSMSMNHIRNKYGSILIDEKEKQNYKKAIM